MIRRRSASGLAPPVAREALASLIDIVEQNVAGLTVGGPAARIKNVGFGS
jgi:hypothetical protein